jgi:acylphosphatase
MEPMKRVQVVVTGDVQGVFFRDNTKDTAGKVGVTGWVRNRFDGAVEAEFQGPPNAVDEMVAFCGENPGRSEVTEVQAREIEVVGGETGFEVR